MSLAMSQWDGFINDVRRDNDARDVARLVREWEIDRDEWRSRSQIWEQRTRLGDRQSCGTLALQAVLEKFVIRCYPNSALIQDGDLRNRIYEAGVKAGALAIENSSDAFIAARDAGRNFDLPRDIYQPIDETEDRYQDTLRQLTDSQLKGFDQLSKARSTKASFDKLRAEFQRVIRDCAHHMAQSAAFREQLTQIDPENPLVVDSTLRRRIADAAYAQLESNGGSDWDVVKEVGRTFVIPGRHVAGAYSSDPDPVHEVGPHSDPLEPNSDELCDPPEHLTTVATPNDDPVGVQASDHAEHVEP